VLDGLRILLVEDDDVDRRRVHRSVKKAGLNVEIIDAVDVEEGRAALEEQDFDCAITDYNLPDGTALDLLVFNRERGDQRVPMVVLTGQDDDDVAIGALKEGAEDYIVKDRFEIDAFVRAVRYAMERASLRRDLEVTNARLQRELEVGGSIQTSILPRDLSVADLEIAASMRPATEVGGDYYDVFSSSDGAWIAIGDVAGHGMAAAIVALMTQSVVAGVTRSIPDATPRRVVAILNEVLHDNIRHRLQQDEHVTFSLLRYHRGGRLVYAGAHEEIVIWRKATGEVDTVMTPGTWLGARSDVSDVTTDEEVTLQIGDVMLLYTDGVTEAFNADGEMFDLERVTKLLADHATEPCAAIHDAIREAVEAWMSTLDDDITLLVVRRTA
jgi:sigma-B regulation protein RsbU (phosphoserine phosphatase)